MNEEDGPSDPQTAAAPQVDPAQLQYAIEQLRSQQNLVAGALAGSLASAAGAGLWAAATLLTGYQIGWLALGVGVLVGIAVRMAGKGIDRAFGLLGAALAGVGCAAGNLLAVCGLIAQHQGVAFLDVLSHLDAAVIQELMVASFSPMDLLFYAIAIYEGYKLSFRQLGPEELGTLLPGH